MRWAERPGQSPSTRMPNKDESYEPGRTGGTAKTGRDAWLCALGQTGGDGESSLGGILGREMEERSRVGSGGDACLVIGVMERLGAGRGQRGRWCGWLLVGCGGGVGSSEQRSGRSVLRCRLFFESVSQWPVAAGHRWCMAVMIEGAVKRRFAGRRRTLEGSGRPQSGVGRVCSGLSPGLTRRVGHPIWHPP